MRLKLREVASVSITLVGVGDERWTDMMMMIRTDDKVL